MIRNLTSCGVFLSAAVVFACADGLAGVKTLTIIPTNTPQYLSTVATVSNDGKTVAGHQFIWSESTGTVPLGSGSGYDVTPDGSTVVGRANGSAFRWTLQAGMQQLPFELARAVTDDGEIVVGYDAVHPHNIIKWGQQNGPEILGTGQATDITGDGQMIVGNGSFFGGFRWTASTGLTENLPRAPHFYTHVEKISADGAKIIGYGGIYGTTQDVVLVWTTGTPGTVGNIDQPDPSLYPYGNKASTVGDISGNGSVIVGWNFGNAFIWNINLGISTSHDYLVQAGVDVPPSVFLHATAVSDDGQTFAGVATNPNSNTPYVPLFAWVTTVPEPSTGLLGFLASLSFLLRRRT